MDRQEECKRAKKSEHALQAQSNWHNRDSQQNVASRPDVLHFQWRSEEK